MTVRIYLEILGPRDREREGLVYEMRGLAFAQAGQGESVFVGRVPSTFEVGMMWGTRPLPPCDHLPG